MRIHITSPNIAVWQRALLAALIAASLFLSIPLQPAAAEDGGSFFRLHIPMVSSSGTAPSRAAPQISGGDEWLVTVNEFRAMANLPFVVEEPRLSLGDELHSRYSVKNDLLTHSEDPRNPWYTPEGLEAAHSSNLMADWNHQKSDREAIAAWMQAPFHAIAILDPELSMVGYGSYREEDGGIQMSAALDVLRGRQGVPAYLNFPIAWPGEGSSVPLLQFWGESPDPLTSCPGYSSPAGLPIYLQVGSGERTPKVGSHSLRMDGQSLEHCVFSETSYKNPDANTQALGRAILADRDAIVLIPKQPLKPGKTYTVSISADGQTYTWSFSTDPDAK